MYLEKTINQLGTSIIDTYMHLALNCDIVKHHPFPEGAKIIAANHPTTTDPFYILPLVKEPVTILITEMAFKSPLLGPILRASGHIPVLEENGRAAFDEAILRLQAGETIAIFPEGALSPPEGGLHRPRTGAVRLALSAGVPVIPVGIALERERIHYVDTVCEDMRATARWYLNGPYALTIGEPQYYTGDINSRDYVKQMSGELLHHIGRLAHESAQRLETRRVLVDSVAGGVMAS